MFDTILSYIIIHIFIVCTNYTVENPSPSAYGNKNINGFGGIKMFCGSNSYICLNSGSAKARRANSASKITPAGINQISTFHPIFFI